MLIQFQGTEKMSRYLLGAPLILIVASAACAAGAIGWPSIRPVSGKSHFDNVAEEKFAQVIVDVAGHPQYKLSCQSGDLDDDDFNYSGLFHCRLVSLKSKETVSSLLLEDNKATSDWEGRGRFLLNDVLGSCGKYADWGSKRTYLVRGMRITLEIANTKLVRTKSSFDVGSFDFNYSVVPDQAAKGSLVEKSKIPEPKWFARSEACADQTLNHLTPKP